MGGGRNPLEQRGPEAPIFRFFAATCQFHLGQQWDGAARGGAAPAHLPRPGTTLGDQWDALGCVRERGATS